MWDMATTHTLGIEREIFFLLKKRYNWHRPQKIRKNTIVFQNRFSQSILPDMFKISFYPNRCSVSFLQIDFTQVIVPTSLFTKIFLPTGFGMPKPVLHKSFFQHLFAPTSFFKKTFFKMTFARAALKLIQLGPDQASILVFRLSRYYGTNRRGASL